MMFDVIRFLDDRGIPWWPPGENVSQGRVGVTCPFCDDTYNHLGLDPKGKSRPYCWKCGGHSLASYVFAKTGEALRSIEPEYGTILTISTILDRTVVRGGASVCTPPGNLDFKPNHKKYLADRGFDPDYIIPKYSLRVTGMTVPYPYRIVVPIIVNDICVSFQCRSYVGATPKYLTCPPEKEVVFHKNTLYNIDNVRGSSVIVVEGVFDAMKLGYNAVATFGTSLSTFQLNLLSQYRRVFFLYDPEDRAQSKAAKAATTLGSMGVQVERVVLDTGDPADLTDSDVYAIKAELGVV